MGVCTLAKMRFAGKRRVPRRKIIFFSSVIFLVLTIQGFWLLENRIEPVLREYANVKVIEIATAVIEFAVKEKIATNPEFSQLFTKVTDINGKIQAITLDAKAANRVQVETTDHVRNSLTKLSTEKITVPLGVALNSSILASLGPNIPITLVPIGATHVEVIPELRQQGINMVLFTINLKITTNLQIVIPFSSDEAVVDHHVTIAQELIIGEVPVYYFNGNQVSPIPIAPQEPNPGNP